MRGLLFEMPLFFSTHIEPLFHAFQANIEPIFRHPFRIAASFAIPPPMTAKRMGKNAPAGAPTADNGFSLISNEKLLQLYSTMVKCRMLESRIRSFCKSSQLSVKGYVAAGQEAAAVGVAIDLLSKDAIVPSSAGLMFDFIRGVPTDRLIRRFGAHAGNSGKDGSSCAWLDNAIKAATGNKISNRGQITVAFCADGLALQESWQEAFNRAGNHKLPIIFVCRYSLWKRPVKDKEQTSIYDAAWRAPKVGFPGIVVDGNDVVAVYRVATEAIAHARRGNGPTLIACETSYHNDSSGKYRGQPYAPRKLGRGRRRDPLLNMEKYLKGKDLFSQGYKRGIAADFRKELDALLPGAVKIAPPAGRHGAGSR